MRTHEIEEWALRAIKRVEQGQPNEDSRIELKADWPDVEKAARRIAGHANAMRGEPILWIIGLDEKCGVIGATQNELADWWPQVKAQFNGPTPELRDVLVDCGEQTTVALYFETDRIPFVVKNPAGGPVQHEVPWREATAVRSATHSDLIQLLSPLQGPILNVEVGKGRGFLNKFPRRKHDIPGARRPVIADLVRVKVMNRGRRIARLCTGYLKRVKTWNRVFRETEYTDFMPLIWSNHAAAAIGDSPTTLPSTLFSENVRSSRDGSVFRTRWPTNAAGCRRAELHSLRHRRSCIGFASDEYRVRWSY